MVIIIVWITILMCAISAIALYIVKGNSVKSKKVETIKKMVLFMKNTLVRYWWNVKSWQDDYCIYTDMCYTVAYNA